MNESSVVCASDVRQPGNDRDRSGRGVKMLDDSVKKVVIAPPQGRYIGHSKNQRPAPDPDFMLVGPGKPCGEYLRRFWHPVCMTEELGKGVPVRLRILGEDLVAFRDLSGHYGLLHLHCSHRNTSLEFGFLAER